jgi:glycerol-3-phosphate acyltransferase PlsX
VNGVVIIAHGSSSALAIRNAVRVAMETVSVKVNTRIEEAMASLATKEVAAE